MLDISNSFNIKGQKLYLYYGFSQQSGAKDQDSPYYSGSSFQSSKAQVIAGEPLSFSINNDHKSNLVKHKFHLQWHNESWQTWLRYTRGGEEENRQKIFAHDAIFNSNYGANRGVTFATSLQDIAPSETQYQQLTASIKYHQAINHSWHLNSLLSFDTTDGGRLPTGYRASISQDDYLIQREDEVLFHQLFNYKRMPLKLALGFEYAAEYFGRDSWGTSEHPASLPRNRPVEHSWHTQRFTLLSEFQYQMNEHLLLIIGARSDKHTYSNKLNTGRTGLVYDFLNRQTFKLMANRAIRRTFDDQLRFDYLTDGDLSANETSDSLELRYENFQNHNLFWGASIFRNRRDVVDFERSAVETRQLGELNSWGAEIELNYQAHPWQITGSHGYVKLLALSLLDPNFSTSLSAQPYGYGDDLAGWSNHISKLTLGYALTDQWRFDSSIQVYWGFAGNKAMADVFAQRLTDNPNSIIALENIRDDGEDGADEKNIYLNLSTQYRQAPFVARLNFHHLLGFFDHKLNKRNYLARASDYRTEAASISIDLSYTF